MEFPQLIAQNPCGFGGMQLKIEMNPKSLAAIMLRKQDSKPFA
jgi:hypothetical protein